MPVRFLFCFAAILFTSCLTANAQNFVQFRGVGGRGNVADASIPEGWQATNAIRWKVDVEGSGWSQPVI